MDRLVAEKLSQLAEACDTVAYPPIAGWTIDSWTLSPDAITRLRRVYVELINPTLEEELIAELRHGGIDVDELFSDAARARDVVTRADMTELAAGASLLEVERVPASHLELSNVPKRSRAASEHGLDCIGFLWIGDDTDARWRSGEQLYLCSVKHTVADPDDLRAKLVESLEPKKLSHSYVLAELRVFVSRLDERGIRARRAYLALADYPNSTRITLMGIGAVGPAHNSAFLEGLRRLPPAHPARKHVRVLVIDGLDHLHELS